MQNAEPVNLLLTYGIDPGSSLLDRIGGCRRSRGGRRRQLRFSAKPHQESAHDFVNAQSHAFSRGD
jgi:hypothetical protein